MGRCRPRRRSPRAPLGYDPTPPADGPRAGESTAYARRRRQPLSHLYVKCSRQLGAWDRGPDGTPGGLVTSPAVTSSSQAGPARRSAAGRRPDRLGRCPDRLLQALPARNLEEEGGRRKEADEGERKREKKRRPEAGGVRQRVGLGSVGCGCRIQRRAESRRGQRRAARRELR